MTRLHAKNQRLLALASLTLIIGATLIVWGTLSLRQPHPPLFTQHSSLITVSTAAFAQPKHYPCPIEGDFKGVDIPVGLLCDYYEHAMEHAPPRDPSGVMQKREHFYAAPHDPFELLPFLATTTAADKVFTSILNSFRTQWERGITADDNGLKSLDQAIAQATHKSDALIDAGRAINWLSGDVAAATFFQAGLTKAAAEYANVPAGDPAALPLLRAMDQTKALWRLKAHKSLEHRFELARRLQPHLSRESRRAGYFVAESLFYQHSYNDAAETILAVQAEHRAVGDLGALDVSDINEMNYMQGMFLEFAGRYRESIPFLERLRSGEHKAQGMKMLFYSLVFERRLRAAESALHAFVTECSPSAVEREWMEDQLAEASQRERWRSENTN